MICTAMSVSGCGITMEAILMKRSQIRPDRKAVLCGSTAVEAGTTLQRICVLPAYRATAPQDQQRFNVGIRLVLGSLSDGSTVSVNTGNDAQSGGNVLIAYFSWGGNTRGIAEEIAGQTGADLFEIECVTPYSTNYNTVLEQAQNDQNIQARPELAAHVEDMEQYDIIILGFPNWWASIPMPIASFLEEYDFTGKTIVPFCSHGGGRFGQSLTAIAKLVPDATLGEGLSVHYSGGSSLPQDVADWLETNQIPLAE